ncbi:MAG: type II toxin-antitoxin system VapC family toxin [Myxococcaceae bacterium]
MLAIVDTGPLYAAVDEGDEDHPRCLAALETRGLRLVIPAMVVAEACYLVRSRMGPKVEADFLKGLAVMDVEAPRPEDFERMAELMKRHSSPPLGGTSACIIALAERLGTDLVISLDQKRLRPVKPRHCPALRFLPGS